MSRVPQTVGSREEGARRAGRAQLALKRGIEGFYVLNNATGIATAGPFTSHGAATSAAFAAQPPAMRVIRIKEGRPAPCR